MKSFFKKLSLVLAAAMVITMLPLQGAKAATAITVGLSGDSKNPNPSAVTLNVGDSQSWKFTGVDKYNAAGAATKKWNSDNPTVVSVNNGAIKALKPGTAKITLQLTNNGIQYAGTTTVTVVDPKAAGSSTIKQTTWNSITIKFDDEAAAKAAQVTVERVKIGGNGKSFYLNVNAALEVKDNTVIVKNLAKDVTYQVTINGKKETITLSYGDPAYIELSYSDAYIGTGYDILGKALTNPASNPTVKVFDSNGIELEKTGTVKYSYDKNNTNKTTWVGQGKIKFQNSESYATVTATYTYKVGTANKTLTDTVKVYPLAYVAPNLGGFVESITLTPLNKRNDKVVYPTDYNFSAEIAVNEEREIAYYFQDQNGKKYAGKEVWSTVSQDGINKMGDKEVYYFVKDDPTATAVSLGKGTGSYKVKGWNEGTEKICLYKQVGTSPKAETDILVGIIDVTVSEEARVDTLGLEDDSFVMFKGSTIAEYQKKEIKYALKDQYNQDISERVTVTDENGNSVSSWVTVDPANTKAKEGKIIFNLNAAPVLDDGKTLKIKAGNFEELITVTVSNINTTDGERSYAVEAKTKDVTNAVVASALLVDDFGTTLKVVETIDGYPYQYMGFRVVSNAEFDECPTGGADNFFVVITNSDEAPVKKTVMGVDIPTSEDVSVATITEYLFDGFKTLAGATPLSELINVGHFTAVLWKTDSADAGAFNTVSSTDFDMVNKAKLVEAFDTSYELKAKSDNKGVEVKKNSKGEPIAIWDQTDVATYSASTDDEYNTLVATIVGQMNGWFDADADGVVDTGELGDLATVFAGKNFQVPTNFMNYVKGAENNEVFIKSVVITYEPLAGGDTPVVSQELIINRKFNF